MSVLVVQTPALEQALEFGLYNPLTLAPLLLVVVVVVSHFVPSPITQPFFKLEAQNFARMRRRMEEEKDGGGGGWRRMEKEEEED